MFLGTVMEHTGLNTVCFLTLAIKAPKLVREVLCFVWALNYIECTIKLETKTALRLNGLCILFQIYWKWNYCVLKSK